MALTRHQIEGYIALRGSGMSIRAMSSAIGISPTTLNKLVIADTTNDDGSIQVPTRTGLDGKRRPGRRFDTTYRDQQIGQLRHDGQTVRQIATNLGCSVGTVHRTLTGQGITPPRR